jgi:hypothetical protein
MRIGRIGKSGSLVVAAARCDDQRSVEPPVQIIISHVELRS